jgi:hypothetical protein
MVLEVDWGDGQGLHEEFGCSGSLLAPSEFLTAGHCAFFLGLYPEIQAVYVTFDENLNADPDRLWFVDPVNLVPVTGWTIHPDIHLTVAKGYNDVAVLDLATPVTGFDPIELPTPSGRISLKVPAGTHAGQKLRLAGRGLSRPDGKSGHLYAVAQIVVPTVIDERQRGLFTQLKDASTFNPRAHMT